MNQILDKIKNSDLNTINVEARVIIYIYIYTNHIKFLN